MFCESSVSAKENLIEKKIIITGEIIQIYNLGRFGYYPKETTGNADIWTLIEEVHSFHYEERPSGLFVVA